LVRVHLNHFNSRTCTGNQYDSIVFCLCIYDLFIHRITNTPTTTPPRCRPNGTGGSRTSTTNPASPHDPSRQTRSSSSREGTPPGSKARCTNPKGAFTTNGEFILISCMGN
jgi:hypothetical protein